MRQIKTGVITVNKEAFFFYLELIDGMDGEALVKEIEFEEVNKLFALAALIISKSRFCFSLSTLPVSALRRKKKKYT